MDLENGVNNFRSEFYEIFGTWWRLPVSVAWIEQSDVGRVSLDAGTPLLKSQVAELQHTFKDDRFDGQFYWVLRSKLEAIGHKTERENIEDIVIWRPPPAKVVMRENQDPDNDEMLQRLVDAGFFKSIEQADAMKRILSKAMFDQLLNHKKPVDLGFIKLWPVPYRTNWKQICLQQDLAADPARSSGISAERVYQRNAKFLESGSLLSVVKTRISRPAPNRNLYDRILWSVEVEYFPIWWKLSKEVEKRAHHLNRNKYALLVRNTMRTLAKNSARLYKQFLEQMARPNASLVIQGKSDYPISVRSTNKRDEAELLDRTSLPRSLPDVLHRERRQQDSATMEIREEAGDLPEMPNMEPSAEHLRNTGPNVLECDNGA